jgi:hypothetical protein
MRVYLVALIFSTGLAMAQVAVEPLRPSSFAEVARYLEADGDAYVYLNSEQLAAKALAFADAVGEVIAIDKPRQGAEIQRLLTVIRQVVSEAGLLEARGFGMSTLRKGGMHSGRAVFYHGDSQPKGRLWQMGGGEPRPFTGLSMMPANTVAAFTGDCRLDLLWKTLEAIATTFGKDLAAAFRDLHRQWGDAGDLDATMGAFTGDVTLFLTLDPAADATEPPALSLLLALGVKDDQLYRGFEHIFGDHPQLSRPEIAGASGFTLQGQDDTLRWWPTVASTAERFIFASNPEIVTTALSLQPGAGLVSSEEFQHLQTGMPTEGNQLLFVSRRLSDQFARLTRERDPEAEVPAPFQMLGVTVRHPDAMVAYSKQSADIASTLPNALQAILAAFSSQQLANSLTRLKADKRPMTLEAIVPEALADADNAALHYDAALSELRKDELIKPLEELATSILDDPTPENRNKWQAQAANVRLATALQEIRSGSAKRFYKDLEWKAGPGMLLPHMSDLRLLSRIINANAVHLAHGGKVDAAWANLAVSLRLADAPVDEPVLISQLVRFAMFAISRKAMLEVAKFGPPTAEQARELDGLLARFENTSPMSRAIDGERLAMGEWVYANFDKPEAGAMTGLPGAAFSLFSLLPSLVDLDRAVYLHALGDVARNLQQPLEQIDRKQEIQPKPYSTLSRLVLPSITPTVKRLVETATEARMARLFLLVMRHHADAGSYPKSLDELRTPHSQIDPFSGNPFEYQRWQDGFSIRGGENAGLEWKVER